MKTSDQEIDAFRPALLDRVHPERGDRLAHPVLPQNQLETLRGVNAFPERYVDQSIGGLSCFGMFDRLRNRRGIPDRAKVRPCANDIAAFESQIARRTRGLNHSLFVVASKV